VTKEGWGSRLGLIQRTSKQIFDDDEEAIRFVWARARAGSSRHARAIRSHARHQPEDLVIALDMMVHHDWVDLAYAVFHLRRLLGSGRFPVDKFVDDCRCRLRRLVLANLTTH
jgi:hypothetical protein